jgi:hypothetical protein
MDIIINELLKKGKKIIILGDFNIDFLGNRVNLQLHTMLNLYGLEAIVDVPTRIGARSQMAVDQIILNERLWEHNFEVLQTGFSDHSAQILQVQMQNKSRITKGQSRVEGEYRMARTYSEENIQYLNHLLEKETWESIFKQKAANNAYNDFLGIFQYYYEIAIPRKWVKSGLP